MAYQLSILCILFKKAPGKSVGFFNLQDIFPFISNHVVIFN